MKKAHMTHTALVGALLVVLTSAAITYIVALSAVAESKPVTVAQDPEYELTRYLLFREDTEDNLIVLLKFISSEGWKWNTNYPVKFEIRDKEGHVVLDHHIKQVTDKRTEVALNVLLKKDKPRPFVVVGVWSMCNTTTCKIFKREINF
jgi:hypothetical protein